MPAAALALAGDWNIRAGTAGWRTTSWLAQRAQLRVYSAGPGRHGDIDYVVSDAPAGKAERFPPPGPAPLSDHDVVVVRLHPPAGAGIHAHPLTVATWNVQHSRDLQLVDRQLTALVRRHSPDVLALQEARQYHRVARQVAQANGYHLVASSRSGQWHNLLLVRRKPGERTAKGVRFVRLSPRGWRVVTGGTHTALWATSCRLDWLRVVCVHMPPSVRWPRRLPAGPPMRVAALVAAMGKLRRWASRQRRRR